MVYFDEGAKDSVIMSIVDVVILSASIGFAVGGVVGLITLAITIQLNR